MLNTTKQPHHHTSERHPTSTQDHVHTPTLLQKLAPFPCRTTLILTLLPLSLTPLITLSVAAEVTSQSYIRGRDCYPNGLWKYGPTATWEIMDSSYFFTPNLSFGAMSFTQVKVIDIAWDLLVGRGGQLALAWVNWRVFNEWVVWCAEGEGVGWRMYAAVSFETTSLSTLGVLGKESLCLEGRRWKRWVRWLGLVSMLLSTLYVLSFPTLMAALTGYIAKSEPYVQDYEGNLIAFGKVDGVRYVVHDAERIGFDRVLVVGERDGELVDAVRKCTYLSPQTRFFKLTCIDMITIAPENNTQRFLFPTLDETYQSRQFSVNTTSQWLFNGTAIELPAPSLNITIHPVAADKQGESILRGTDIMFVINGRQGDLYDPGYMLDHGSCKPGETYQWGFSYIFLFMVSIFNFIWACIMVGMWLDTRRGSRLYRSGRRPGLLRSIVEFAAAIKEEVGDGTEDMEEEELRERLRASEGRLGVPSRELRVVRVDTDDGNGGVRKRGWKRSLTRGSTF